MPEAETIVIPITVPVALARDYLDMGLPLPLTATPRMIREAIGQPDQDPRERFSELDRLIAEVVDYHGPAQAPEIARILEDEHDHITSDKGVRDRFGSALPLKQAGYFNTRNGYRSPSP